MAVPGAQQYIISRACRIVSTRSTYTSVSISIANAGFSTGHRGHRGHPPGIQNLRFFLRKREYINKNEVDTRKKKYEHCKNSALLW